MKDWKEKALEQVEEIYKSVDEMGISIYKNFLDRDTWLLVELGKNVVLEIACAGEVAYVFNRVNDKLFEHKEYKSAKWLVKYVKKQFEKELSKAV